MLLLLSLPLQGCSMICLFCFQDSFVRAKKWVQELQRQGNQQVLLELISALISTCYGFKICGKLLLVMQHFLVSFSFQKYINKNYKISIQSDWLRWSSVFKYKLVFILDLMWFPCCRCSSESKLNNVLGRKQGWLGRKEKSGSWGIIESHVSTTLAVFQMSLIF